MRTVLVSRASVSSRQLARRLGIRRIIVGERSIPLGAKTVINWGCGDIPGLRGDLTILNRPSAVREAVDKKITFNRLRDAGVPTVEFTDSKKQAEAWLAGGSTVYGRHVTRGSKGDGIALYIGKEGAKRIKDAPLYTKFYPCTREVRVHVVGNNVVDFAEKRKVNDFADPPPERFWVRTHANGWIYARANAQLSDKARDAAIRAVRALGLDFGAVDMRVKESGGCAVLEVNSAPGIIGTTLENYEAAFGKLLKISS